jgi:branched-chain amino acid transport system ATP-binding protein
MLKLQAVEVAYGHIMALAGISLEVRDGELVALLGANGAGKSTALMAISGIVRPRSGKLAYNGTDLSKASPFDIVGLGVIQCP